MYKLESVVLYIAGQKSMSVMQLFSLLNQLTYRDNMSYVTCHSMNQLTVSSDIIVIDRTKQSQSNDKQLIAGEYYLENQP